MTSLTAAGSIEIRRAGPADQAALLAPMREFYRVEELDFDEREQPAALARLLADERLGEVWIAVARGGAVIGYAALCFGYSLEFRGRDAFLDELFVDAAWRGRGIAGRLMDRLEERCVALDVRALHLEVDDRNDHAFQIYRRRGFARHERRLMTWRPRRGS